MLNENRTARRKNTGSRRQIAEICYHRNGFEIILPRITRDDLRNRNTGADKCGTSALGKFLQSHPDIIYIGETYFFTRQWSQGPGKLLRIEKSKKLKTG